MNQNNQLSLKNNQINWRLAVASVVSLFLFSFMGAPFVRVLASTAKAGFFWGLGIILSASLFYFNLPVASVYVGAVWMTLGTYSGLEKRGITWKKTTAISILMGLMFGAICFLVLTRGLDIRDAAQYSGNAFLSDLINPIKENLKLAWPEKDISHVNIISYLPGVFASALVAALAVSLIFEAKIFQLFQIRRERIASSLKWVEFRVPDAFIWASLVSFLFSMVSVGNELVKLIAMNFAVFCVVVFFIQGMSVIEFMSRVYRWGLFTKIALYFLVIAWLGPAVAFLGLVDYWFDFRKMVRKKLK